jgi:hypothetical protein
VQVYTAFGYDGVGACRRIKDELTNLLEKQGTTWLEVVQNAAQPKLVTITQNNEGPSIDGRAEEKAGNI